MTYRQKRALASVLMIAGIISTTAAAPLKQTLWVFPAPSGPNPVIDGSARQTLVARAGTSGIAELYVSIYNSTPNSAGRYMYDEAAISDLIMRAHNSGMQVFAAYGAPDWPTFGCNVNGFPLQRMAEVAAYNAANTSAKLDGVVLDIEPPEPQSVSDFQALLGQYTCIRSALPNDVKLSVAICFFWDTTIEYPAGSGISKPVYAHVIDMNLTNVVVMGYRDFAGPSDCSNDGIICLDQNEIGYAMSVGKAQLILAGLETSDPAITGISNKETFFEEGATVMNTVTRSVIDHFGQTSGLGGFAIHNYGNSYLTGAASWPTSNPSFPTNVLAITAITRLHDGTVQVTGLGVPNHSHTVQAAIDPNSGSFPFLETVTPDNAGALHFDDSPSPNLQRKFYRITFP